MPSCAAMAPLAQHRGEDAQLACDLDQRPTAARQQGDRLPLELIRKMTPFLTHSTPFRSHRSLAKVSTNSGEAHVGLNNLAGLYLVQGRYAEAEPLYKRGLDIEEKALGRDNPGVAIGLNSLAELYRVQGRHSEAELLYERSLMIW